MAEKTIESLRQENELIDLFCTLAQIPSPSGEEDKVSAKIVEILTNSGAELPRFMGRSYCCRNAFLIAEVCTNFC